MCALCRSYGCALRVSRCALVVCFIVLMLSRYNTDTMLQYLYIYFMVDFLVPQSFGKPVKQWYVAPFAIPACILSFLISCAKETLTSLRSIPLSSIHPFHWHVQELYWWMLCDCIWSSRPFATAIVTYQQVCESKSKLFERYGLCLDCT